MKKRFYKKPSGKRLLVNRQIRVPRVRVIAQGGEQIGVMVLERALQLAKDKGLDLIQVTDKVEPPVCKLGDYGKFLYQKKKKEQKVRGKQAGELKGIRLSFGISEHDMKVRVKQAEKFLKKGYKVRLEMRLRGRQKALGNFAKEKINKFLEALGELVLYKVERELKREARGLTMIISHKPG